MLLTPRPADITTHEQNILWSFAQLKTALAAATVSAEYPKQVIESQGYYASEIVSIQEIASVDGGPRHILRVLMPVSPDYYGSSNPVWKFAKSIAPGGDIGMNGLLIPGSTDRFRFNRTVNGGSVERLQAGSTTWVNVGQSGSFNATVYGSDGKLYSSHSQGAYYSLDLSINPLTFVSITAAQYTAAIANPQSPIVL